MSSGYEDVMASVQDRMKQVAAGLPSVSARIRALRDAGFERTEIARFLGKRYQHVRNVLVQDEERKAKAARMDADKSASVQLRPTKVRLGPDGRVVIPAPFREALNLKEGDILMALADDGEIHFLTGSAAIRRAQAIVKTFVPEGVSLVDELLEDRRREFEREIQDG